MSLSQLYNKVGHQKLLVAFWNIWFKAGVWRNPSHIGVTSFSWSTLFVCVLGKISGIAIFTLLVVLSQCWHKQHKLEYPLWIFLKIYFVAWKADVIIIISQSLVQGSLWCLSCGVIMRQQHGSKLQLYLQFKFKFRPSGQNVINPDMSVKVKVHFTAPWPVQTENFLPANNGLNHRGTKHFAKHCKRFCSSSNVLRFCYGELCTVDKYISSSLSYLGVLAPRYNSCAHPRYMWYVCKYEFILHIRSGNTRSDSKQFLSFFRCFYASRTQFRRKFLRFSTK